MDYWLDQPVRHLLALGKYQDSKNRKEVIEQKLAQVKVKQRKDLDALRGLS